MRKIKLLSFALILALLFSAVTFPAVAEPLSDEEHIFTYEELACVTEPVGLATDSDGFTEIKKVESEIRSSSGSGIKTADAGTQTIYYIIETADGYLMTSPMSGTFSRTRYSTGNSNSHLYQKWIFDKGTDGHYTVYSNTDSARCLTVNPSTKAVTLSVYTGSQYQKWKMYQASGGNALASAATDTAVKNYKLVIGSTSCSVSNTGYTPVGFFDVSWYIPPTALSHARLYLAPGQSRYVYPTKTPSNANGCSNNWLKWSVSPVNSMPAVVSSDGKVTAGDTPFDSAQLTFMDKVTRVYGSCYVTVTEIVNGTYYLKNKQNSNYAKVKSGTMTNGQNVVQYDLEQGNAERWVFTLNTATGYYSIKSANSGSTSYYMTVSDDATTVGKPIVIRSATESTLTDGMKWRVEKTASGAYKLCPKTGESNGYVLNTSTASGSNNANLTQDTYVQNTSYRDEWILERMLPTNGSELPYDTSLWNYSPVVNNSNCYAYALNNQVYGPTSHNIWWKQQPGEYYNLFNSTTPIPQGFNLPASIIVNGVSLDFSMYNSVNGTSVTFTPIGRYEKCPAGTYKVALVVSNSDYHWYRQDADGLWSHKQGTTAVKRTDESGKLIIDPKLADRGDYTTFVGYFAVKPWNNLYSSSKSAELQTVKQQVALTLVGTCDLQKLQAGMSYEQVIDILGEGVDIGSGTLILQYRTNDGTVSTLYFESTETGFRLLSVDMKG